MTNVRGRSTALNVAGWVVGVVGVVSVSLLVAYGSMLLTLAALRNWVQPDHASDDADSTSSGDEVAAVSGC